MDTFEVGQTFVRYFPEGLGGDSFKAVVTGILEQNGKMLTICIIPSRQSRIVPRSSCRPIPAREVRSGLTQFLAHWHENGVTKSGLVVDEEIIDGLLHVAVSADGNSLNFLALTEVTFSCGCA